MKYVLLTTKKFKQIRNQKLHLLDSNGKTYCQTENVRRRKNQPEFLEFDDAGGRQVCKNCKSEKRRRQRTDNAEPDLRVIMGEKMA